MPGHVPHSGRAITDCRITDVFHPAREDYRFADTEGEGHAMSDRFTAEAKAMWDAIPPQAQEQILSNVWCVHCKTGTTIVDFNGRVEKGDLILRGRCVTCGGEVARLIEGE